MLETKFVVYRKISEISIEANDFVETNIFFESGRKERRQTIWLNF